MGGQYTAIYTDSSAVCWNGQGHHQRALWANIFSLRKHFRCPGIKALLCFPFSCLMAVIRFLLLWFLLSLRPFTTWARLRPKWDMSFVSVVKRRNLSLFYCGVSPSTFSNIAMTKNSTGTWISMIELELVLQCILTHAGQRHTVQKGPFPLYVISLVSTLYLPTA